MVTIFCQYSIGGFKIYNISKFPHQIDGGVYVTMREIRDGEESINDSITVIRGNLCGLTPEELTYFNHSGAKLIYKNESANKDLLFVKRVGHGTDTIGRTSESSFAFVAEGETDCRNLRKLACLFMGSTNEYEPLIAGLINQKLIEGSMVLFFDQAKWNSVWEELSGITVKVNEPLKEIANGNKYALVYDGDNLERAIKPYEFGSNFRQYIHYLAFPSKILDTSSPIIVENEKKDNQSASVNEISKLTQSLAEKEAALTLLQQKNNELEKQLDTLNSHDDDELRQLLVNKEAALTRVRQENAELKQKIASQEFALTELGDLKEKDKKQSYVNAIIALVVGIAIGMLIFYK